MPGRRLMSLASSSRSTTRRGAEGDPKREKVGYISFAIPNESQPRRALPSGQPICCHRLAGARFEASTLRILEQGEFDHSGVPRLTVIPRPTSATIVWMKSGASNRAQAWPSATRASITAPFELAMIA
jgi:hypothetical protein